MRQRGEKLGPLIIESQNDSELVSPPGGDLNSESNSMNPKWTVHDSKRSSNRWLWDAESSHSGYVVIRDNFHPGWKAFLDGREVKVYRADYLNSAVAWPEGRHQLLYVFAPRSWRLGLWVSGFCGLLLLLVILVPPWRRVPFPN